VSTLNKLVKSVSILAAALVATASIADADESLQLSQLTAGFDAETKYMASCFACHSTGAAGAPKVVAGNAAVWDERLAKGMDAVMTTVINGKGAMPAKGLCFDCTDDDLRAIVDYMVAGSK
jgi:cytochrome c5